MTLRSSIAHNVEGPLQLPESQLQESELQRWWHQWEVRGLLIIIILVQFILLLFGSKRKFKYYRLRGPFFVRPLVWGAYLISDWVPGFALGVISNILGNIVYRYLFFDMEVNPYLLTLWATLILMHLGGPDNITAYSLEDNELWPRHLVALVAQTSLTAYIIFLPGNGIAIVSPLKVLIVLLGFIKYGERIWSLYSASTKLRSSSIRHDIDQNLSQNTSSAPEHKLLHFKFLFTSFFADVVLSTGLIEKDRLYFQEIGCEKAFREVKKELGLAYDVFYTKALVRYTIWGYILAFINLFGAVILFVFSIIIIVLTGPDLAVVDVILMLLLSIVALLSATTSFSYLIPSSFTSPRLPPVVISVLRMSLWFQPEDLRRETSLFVQYDFVALCRKNKSSRPGNLDISFSFLKSDYRLKKESIDLRKMIFNNIKGKSEKHMSSNMPNFRDYISAYNHGELKWASKLEFQRSIILWHIATNICYYCDNRDDEEKERYARVSKNVSDYMFYLLLECRYMLPVGLGLVTLQDTYVEAIKFLKTQEVLESDVGEAYRKLLQFQPQEGVQDTCSRSLLSRACRLAEDLLAHHRNQMWKFLADQLWVEILGYAAAKCSANNHAQQLRRGGELLSQVWLLQAHFGVLEQFGGTEMQQDPQNEAHKGTSEFVVDIETQEAALQGIIASHQETSVPDQSPNLLQSTIPSIGTCMNGYS